MTKPEEFLFTGKCTGSSQESSPCWATPAAPSQNTRPPLGVNLFLFRARGVWLCKRKPAELRLALGPAFSQWPDKVLIVLCHMVAAFGWKERDSHTGLQAALWKREKSRQTHTEGGRIPAEGLFLHWHTRYRMHKTPGSGQHHPKPKLCQTRLAQPSLPCVIPGPCSQQLPSSSVCPSQVLG